MRARLLTTIALCCVLFGCIASTTYAQSVKTLSSIHQLNINILADGTLDINHVVELTNQDSNLLQSWQVGVLASQAQIKVTRDGQSHPVQVVNGRAVINFGSNPIRSQAKTTLAISYALPRRALVADGLYSVYLPAFVPASTESANYKVIVNFPADFPRLTYSSLPNENTASRQYTNSSQSALWLVFGERFRLGVNELTKVSPDGPVGFAGAINLPSEHGNQSVSYTDITSEGTVAYQRHTNNLWWITDSEKDLAYEAVVDLQNSFPSPRTNFWSVNYSNVNWPTDLSNPPDLYQKTREAYGYTLQKLKPSAELKVTSQQMQSVADIAASQSEASATSLQYAAFLAGLLNSQNIPTNISYGYLLDGNQLPDINTRNPLAWVEAQIDEEVLILDPYLEDITGLPAFNLPRINRLHMGVWDPAFAADNVLGMLGDSLRPAPQFVHAKELNVDPQITLAVEGLPKEAVTLQPYNVTLRVVNDSDHIIGVHHLYWDNIDVAEHALRIDQFLTRAIRPYSAERVEVLNLVLPQLFFEGQQQHVWTLQTSLVDYPELTAVYNISYSLNDGVLVAMLAVVVFGLLLVVVGFWRREALRQYKLYKVVRKQKRETSL